MKKLKIEKRCEDIVTYDGKLLDTSWLIRNNFLKLSLNEKNEVIYINKSNQGRNSIK